MELLTIQRLAIEQSYSLLMRLLIVGLLCTALILVLMQGQKFRPYLISQKAQSILIFLASLPILNYLILVFFYLICVDYADPAEANIASVAWLFQTRHPLYPTLDAAERYINNYGPFLYFIQGFFLNLLRPSFFASKVAGSVAGCLSLLLTFLTFRRHLTLPIALTACSVMSLCCLSMTSASGLLTASFWLRPDSLLLFCSTIAIYSIVCTPARIALIICAIAFGVSVNLKITAFLHFLPIYLLVLQRFGLKVTLGSLLISLGVAIVPFIMPQVSLGNYLIWLQQVKRKGINPSQVTKNLLWMGYMMVPCTIAALHLGFTNRTDLRKWLQQDWIYLSAFAICAGINAIFGATRGALENNMLPFLPLLVYALNQLLQKISFQSLDNYKSFAIFLVSLSATLGFIISTTVTVYSTEVPFLDRLRNAPGYGAIQDIDRFRKTHIRSTIAIGYGESNYQLSTQGKRTSNAVAI